MDTNLNNDQDERMLNNMRLQTQYLKSMKNWITFMGILTLVGLVIWFFSITMSL